MIFKDTEILQLCIEEALKSTCLRSKCGSIITSSNGLIVGKGFNSPPLNKYIEICNKDNLSEKFKSDKTCCMHAEQRAIIDALQNSYSLLGSCLYFIRLDQDNNPLKAGDPYCTICSKMALDVQISYFCLWNGSLFIKYNTIEYNKKSFNYGQHSSNNHTDLHV